MNFTYGIVIVTYDISLKKMLKKIKEFKSFKLQTVFVNNGKKVVKSCNKDYVNVINLNENKGIAYGQNIGTKFLREKYKVKYVFFLDQDSIVSRNFFHKMMLVWESLKFKDVNIGLLSPHIFNLRTSSFDGIPLIKENKIEFTNFNNEVFFVKNVLPISSGSLVSVEAFDSVGGNNEELFIDCVDFDLALKLINTGYSVYNTGECILKQTIGDTKKIKIFRKVLFISNHSPFRDYYYIRNIIYLRNTYKYSFPQIKSFARRLFKQRILSIFFENDKLKRIYFFSKGVVDGIKGDLGKI